MSITFLKLIPVHPEFTPNQAELIAVRDWMKVNYHDNDETRYVLTDEVRFIDQGENFENIHCPCCSRQIDISWWQQKMDEAYKSLFHSLQIVLDCCGEAISLSDLEYKWAAGFARFSIEIMNPESDLIEKDISKLEQILKCSIRKVLAYY
ncbi:hypothetical protein OB236_15570 [Paenibacillus sp. WQ 127069]|uniref:Phage protein n=1 Tax=Paenibacillus baimaensis TaxID=2982185 RepID=A0ABT2UFV3_9BACL|nr:hypothetical protein [Paenibacillus sp. WQ 127069]MCU6793523.1 hypothetical protein [Paenibacillus sp. WQ 127069]